METVYRSTEEVQDMLIKALAREKERYFQEGLEQCLEQGREKGLVRGLEQGRE